MTKKQIYLAIIDKGIEEAKLLLQDWITMLITHYNEVVLRIKDKVQPSDVDVNMVKSPKLRVIFQF